VASDQARQLRLQGIAAAKAGQKEEARKLLQQSIRLEPNNDAAWLWMAFIAC
jgi:Tfp pilus assembly protein PilF